MGRLLAMVAQNPRSLGVGIDENTAIVFEGECGHVVGAGGGGQGRAAVRAGHRGHRIHVHGGACRRHTTALVVIRAHVHDQEVTNRPGDLIEVGSPNLLPEFTKELDGARAGDILKFNGTAPEGSGEHTGQEVAFQVLPLNTSSQ